MLVTSRHRTSERVRLMRIALFCLRRTPEEIRSRSDRTNENTLIKVKNSGDAWKSTAFLLTLNCVNGSSDMWAPSGHGVDCNWWLKRTIYPAHCIVIVRHSIVFHFYVLAVERNYVFDVLHKEGDAQKLCEQETLRDRVRERAREMERENDQKKGTKFSQTDVNFIVVII